MWGPQPHWPALRIPTIANLERRLHFVALVLVAGFVILLIHLAFYPWPDISHVLQPHHPRTTSK